MLLYDIYFIVYVVGDAISPDVLESGAAMLFQLFMDKSHVTASETLIIRQKFGPHSLADAQLICGIVQR